MVSPAWGCNTPGSFIHPSLILLPCHPSENPTFKSPFHFTIHPQILVKNLYFVFAGLVLGAAILCCWVNWLLGSP